MKYKTYHHFLGYSTHFLGKLFWVTIIYVFFISNKEGNNWSMNFT